MTQQAEPPNGTHAEGAPPTPPAKPSPPAQPTVRPPPRKPAGFFLKQANMRRVVYSLVPVAVAAVYFYGWRVVAVLSCVFAAGIATEFITSRQRKQPVSMAVLVTCSLLGLALPPLVPFWVAAVGAAVAVLFGKEVFGGFGRNFANPAIVGRTFLYICFPIAMTAQFVPAFQGFPAGLARWSWLDGMGATPAELSGHISKALDAVTQATPQFVQKSLGSRAAIDAVSLWDMALGNIHGVFISDGRPLPLAGGSAGEGCAIIILASAVYLFITKTANWRLSLSALLGLAAGSLVLRHGLGHTQPPGEVPPFLFSLLSGTTVYAMVFMVTDPVSAPKKVPAQWAYGLLIGLLIVFLRWKSVFVAAASFSILLGNIVAPLLDIGAGWWAGRRKPNADAANRPPAREGAA